MKYVSVSGKNWILKKFDSIDIKKYTENHSLSEIAAKLLSIRKNNIENIDLYLNPTIKNLLPNPFSLKDMNRAVDRTYESIIKNEKIGVFGDYDVDGATSTALLYKYFLLLKQKIITYIPDRKKEGYGPSNESINKLINLGAKVIFTVDCGTLSYEPIQTAQKQNIDVIILDHHQSDIKLPKACALINPNRIDDTSKLNYLCAVGVCFIFLVALNKKLREQEWFKRNNLEEPDLINFLDLVSLGTVCDVVPLVGLNRAIVKQGLKVLKKRSNLGIKTLFDLTKNESKPTTYDLGYVLGPRINAGGRVGKSSHGVNLLSSDDPQTAFKLASDLEKLNKERQTIEFLLYEKVEKILKKFINDPVFVLQGNDWHEGVIGIVASRIKEKYGKPTILVSIQKDKGKGSARSIFGFDIGSLIIKGVQMGILEKGGGHKMAGGFVINEDKISIFRNFLIKNYEKLIITNNRNKNLYIDTIVSPSALNEDFYEEIDKLSPYGSGNTEPKFVIENLKIISSNIISNKHIKAILLGQDGSVFKGITFNAVGGPIESILNKKNRKKINVAGKMKLNEWRGEKKVEFIIEDISV